MPETAPRRILSTRKVVFLVIAAAAPMGAMVGNVPLALTRTHGIGLPVAFVLASVILLCFSVGYGAMNARVVNSGAFYTYIARAMGKPAGAAGAYAALVGYTAMALGIAAAFGYFTHLVFDGLGMSVPWYVFTAVGIVLVGFLGYRSAELSAKVLGVLMVLEFAILLVFNFLVVGAKGLAAFPSESFAPNQAFSGTLGIGLLFALTSFIGFESAAIYGEESKNPERTVPRAMYISVASISAFYVVTAWIIIGAAGGTEAPAMAEAQLGDMVFTLAKQYGGEILYSATAVLLCTSVLASYLALHNAASRYLFALGREGMLPAALGGYHAHHLSPHIGSLTVTGITVLVLGAMALLGADPYTVIAAGFVGLGTLGIIFVQAVTAVAVLVFFWKRPDRSLWRGIVAPAIGAAGLGTGFVLVTLNYSILTGSDSAWVNLVPLLLPLVAVLGIFISLRQRRSNPSAYANFAASELRRRSAGDLDDARPATYTRRYCVVGGGPASMVMARALIGEGVPFDWFEKNPDFGGIWDMENPGTPMYASAHFISSKYTSGFYGYPMPESFPDYPRWDQIRDYVRGFGREFGLYDHITFNAKVADAELHEDGTWSVRLADGTEREYDGLIAAPGVTWHPKTPLLRGQELYTGRIRHSVHFVDGLELRGKRVLVIGGGNSGVDIACEAARNADAAFLSVRRGYRYFPKHIGGIPTDALVTGILEPPPGIALSRDLNQVLDSLVGDVTRFGLPAPDHAALASHPIMNSQVLHHLSHGDLTAKGDVDRLTEHGAVFADGSTEEIDEILLATGYEYRIPFLDPQLLDWKSGRPQLYLNVFPRRTHSLYVLGLIEFADAAYKRFDEMAQLVLMDIRARETGEHRETLLALKSTDDPDLSGGIAYVDSPRHASYVESRTYQAYLASLRDRFGWPDVGEESFDRLRAGREKRRGDPDGQDNPELLNSNT